MGALGAEDEAIESNSRAAFFLCPEVLLGTLTRQWALGGNDLIWSIKVSLAFSVGLR